MGKGRKQGADKPALVGPRGPVSGGGGGATSRREAALPKNEVPTSRLKTHPSALEHGKEWRNILLLRPKNAPSPAKHFGRRRRILRHGKAAGESIRSIQRISQYTRSKARCVVVGLAGLAPGAGRPGEVFRLPQASPAFRHLAGGQAALVLVLLSS